jgi:hypothetical protein
MAVEGLMLSGSTHGAPIKVAATSIGSGTTVHTATSSTSDGDFDEIYLWVSNTDTAVRTLTLGWGGTTNPDHLIVDAFVVPANLPPLMVVVGLRLRNSLVVKAAASAADVLLVTGHVNRYL